MVQQKKWLAVYTRPNWEKKVSMLLAKKNVENFCPLITVVRQWADRKKTLHEPLFKSYVFVYVSKTEYDTVWQTEGIVSFVQWLGVPAAIKNEEIDYIKKLLPITENVRLEKTSININDKVKILSGALIDKEGTVLQVKKSTIRVYLPSLGYILAAEVNKTLVEVISVLETGVAKPN